MSIHIPEYFNFIFRIAKGHVFYWRVLIRDILFSLLCLGVFQKAVFTVPLSQ
nr:MAG TPA: hypothetical protein [Caudoviricetes sp.]